jgi:hypothetical protein
MAQRIWPESETPANRPGRYFDYSTIEEETLVTLKYLKRVTQWFLKIANMENYDSLRRPDEEIRSGAGTLRAIDNTLVRDSLKSTRQSARNLVEESLGDVSTPRPREIIGRSDPDYVPAAPIYVLDARLNIHKGLLERFRPEPIIAESDDRAVCKFIAIAGIKNVLARDNQQGWHYHYCKPNGKRSDTILTFDRDNAALSNPLFWERHRERNSSFYAKAELWGHDKRQSAYSACAADLNRPSGQFRRPSNKAKPVWPISALLSNRELTK